MSADPFTSDVPLEHLSSRCLFGHHGDRCDWDLGSCWCRCHDPDDATDEETPQQGKE